MLQQNVHWNLEVGALATQLVTSCTRTLSTAISEDRKSSKLNTSRTLEYESTSPNMFTQCNKETTDETPGEIA